jgi:hypothetical protein
MAAAATHPPAFSYVLYLRHAIMGAGPSRPLSPAKLLLSRAIPPYRPRTLTAHPNAYVVGPDDPETRTDQRLRWSEPMWSPPPESNRRRHPYHVSPAHRHATLRLRRSPRTVRGAVMGWPAQHRVDARLLWLAVLVAPTKERARRVTKTTDSLNHCGLATATTAQVADRRQFELRVPVEPAELGSDGRAV